MILHHLKIPKHMITIVYTGAQGLPNCPVDHCLFFWDGVASSALDECKWCLQRNIPTKERYSCAKLYGIPTGSISLHCVSVHWPRGIPWEFSDTSLCSLSLSLSIEFILLFLLTSPPWLFISQWDTHHPFSPSTHSHTQCPDLQHIT